jgi:hypothetical protein
MAVSKKPPRRLRQPRQAAEHLADAHQAGAGPGGLGSGERAVERGDLERRRRLAGLATGDGEDPGAVAGRLPSGGLGDVEQGADRGPLELRPGLAGQAAERGPVRREEGDDFAAEPVAVEPLVREAVVRRRGAGGARRRAGRVVGGRPRGPPPAPPSPAGEEVLARPLPRPQRRARAPRRYSRPATARGVTGAPRLARRVLRGARHQPTRSPGRPRSASPSASLSCSTVTTTTNSTPKPPPKPKPRPVRIIRGHPDQIPGSPRSLARGVRSRCVAGRRWANACDRPGRFDHPPDSAAPAPSKQRAQGHAEDHQQHGFPGEPACGCNPARAAPAGVSKYRAGASPVSTTAGRPSMPSPPCEATATWYPLAPRAQSGKLGGPPR